MNLKWQIIRELYAVSKQHVFESEEYKAFLKKQALAGSLRCLQLSARQIQDRRLQQMVNAQQV
jgi:hypothetical protein